MSYIIIEILTLAAILMAIRNQQFEQQTNPVVIPVRTDETIRRS